jgi:hypothetical protein
MSKLTLSVLALSAGLWLFAGRAAADDDKVVKKVDGDMLKELLEEEGFKGITVEKPSKDIHVVLMKIDGKKILIFCDLKAGDVTCRFSISGTNATRQKINTWNDSKKFFKAHLDKDGDPVLEHSLVIKYGVTVKTVKEFVMLMELGMKTFIKEVCD